MGLVGAELRRVPGLLAAASPFPDLPLKAKRTSRICAEYANVLGNVTVKWTSPAQEIPVWVPISK